MQHQPMDEDARERREDGAGKTILRLFKPKGPVQFLMGYGLGGLFLVWAVATDLYQSEPALRGALWFVVTAAPFVLLLRVPGTPIGSLLALAAAMAWAREMWAGDPDGLGGMALLAVPAAA